MVDRDVSLAKIATVDRCLRRIAEVRRPGRGLSPIDIEDITALNLQRAVQAVIDLASHVVSTEGYGMPDSLAAAFTLLEERDLIDSELAGRMRKMVGFRNVVVHAYEAVDPLIVEAIVTHHLGDLRAFSARIAEHFELEES